MSSSRALRSRRLFSRWSCSSDMAERSAIASGFSLSEMGTEGGCCLKVAAGGGCGGATRGRVSAGSGRASCAAATVGVIGDTGGRLGDRERERRWEGWSEGVEELLGEVDGGLVSTRSAGMAEVECRLGGQQKRYP